MEDIRYLQRFENFEKSYLLLKEALMDRNLTVHTYDESIANEVYEKIKEEYSILIEQLYAKFKDTICLD